VIKYFFLQEINNVLDVMARQAMHRNNHSQNLQHRNKLYVEGNKITAKISKIGPITADNRDEALILIGEIECYHRLRQVLSPEISTDILTNNIKGSSLRLRSQIKALDAVSVL
jgi:hypothetical protein